MLREATGYTERGREPEEIAHYGRIIHSGFKEMLMLEAAEVAFDHDVAEVARRIVAIDKSRMGEHQAEVTPAPRFD